MPPPHRTGSHLHGHKFQIVHKSLNVTSDNPSINPPATEGQVNPVRRDTVQIPKEVRRRYSTIRA